MLFFVLFSLILFSSCGANEDAVANESAKKIEFIKTNEMLSFESSLKDWFQAKRENVNNEAKTKLSAKVVQDAKALLNTLGKTDLAKQSTENPELFVILNLENML